MLKKYSKIRKINDISKKFKIPKAFIEKRIKSGHLEVTTTSKCKYIYEEELILDVNRQLNDFLLDEKYSNLYNKAFEIAYSLDVENEAILKGHHLTDDIIKRRQKDSKTFGTYKDVDKPKEMWLQDEYNTSIIRVPIPFQPHLGKFTRYYSDFLFDEPQISFVEPNYELFAMRDSILEGFESADIEQIRKNVTSKIKNLFFHHFILGKKCNWFNDDF